MVNSDPSVKEHWRGPINRAHAWDFYAGLGAILDALLMSNYVQLWKLLGDNGQYGALKQSRAKGSTQI